MLSFYISMSQIEAFLIATGVIIIASLASGQYSLKASVVGIVFLFLLLTLEGFYLNAPNSKRIIGSCLRYQSNEIKKVEELFGNKMLELNQLREVRDLAQRKGVANTIDYEKRVNTALNELADLQSQIESLAPKEGRIVGLIKDKHQILTNDNVLISVDIDDFLKENKVSVIECI